jgi:hypothetical protein
VSYLSQTELANDPEWQSRVRGCCVEQAYVFKDDGRADLAALAGAIMRQDNEQLAFFTLSAAAPGFADSFEAGNPIADPDILAAVQAEWPTVAALYYAPDGTPLTGGS